MSFDKRPAQQAPSPVALVSFLNVAARCVKICFSYGYIHSQSKVPGGFSRNDRYGQIRNVRNGG